MKIALIWKLFAILLINAAVIVGIMASVMYFSVSNNFEKYMYLFDNDRFQSVVEILENEYAVVQNWQEIHPNPQHWLMGFRTQNPTPHHNRQRNVNDANQALSNEEDIKTHNQYGDGRNQKGMGRQNPASSHSRLKSSIPNKNNTLFLLDAKKEKIWGVKLKREPEFFQPIHHQSQIVGWLGMYSTTQNKQPGQVHFMDQQLRMLTVLTIVAVLTASFLAYFLSRYLLRPVHKLTLGTRAISGRQFDTRVDIQSQDEFGQLATDFNKMAETLDSFEKQRQQWISDISHELGTPLSVLRGEIEALQDGIRKADPVQFASLHTEVMHLARIVDDLKLINRAEAGQLQLCQVEHDPVILFRNILMQYADRLKEHDLDLHVQLPENSDKSVMMDSDRIRQVFVNLLENVIRYVAAPAKVTGSCLISKENITLILEDTGPGVSEESLSHLFDRFYRAEISRNRASGGSGLGLSICKNLIEAHHGTIRAELVEPHGLRMLITIPY